MGPKPASPARVGSAHLWCQRLGIKVQILTSIRRSAASGPINGESRPDSTTCSLQIESQEISVRSRMPDPFFLLSAVHALMKSLVVLFVFGLLVILGRMAN